MILIVDDKRENILPLKKILSLHSLESDSAESGEEALKLILQRDYTLIIMDVQMPGMDGFEVAEILAGSNRTKDIPVIFLSAISKEKKYISKGYETGGVDYITKPVDPDLLILKVKTFLKLYEQQRELKMTRDLLSKEIEIRKEAQENLEQKILQRTAQLVKKNSQLEFSNHELQQFAWVVSHDLKEPLRKIEIFVKILRDRYVQEDPAAINYIERTVASAERMSQLISDLLHYARLSSQVLNEKVDLNATATDVISDLEFVIDSKKVVLTIDPLPVVYGVPSQLRQVFQNLLSNAIKFSKTNVIPHITITAAIIAEKEIDSKVDPNGQYCRIVVKDNGIGFDITYLNKIFIIFQSLNDRKSYQGTGVGLAIAKKIIEKHNGLITAESVEGEGASFILVLPLFDPNLNT